MPMANPTSGEMYLLPISMKPPMLGEYTVLTLQRRPWITRRKRSHFTEAVHHHADEAADDGVPEEEANRSTILRRGQRADPFGMGHNALRVRHQSQGTVRSRSSRQLQSLTHGAVSNHQRPAPPRLLTRSRRVPNSPRCVVSLSKRTAGSVKSRALLVGAASGSCTRSTFFSSYTSPTVVGRTGSIVKGDILLAGGYLRSLW